MKQINTGGGWSYTLDNSNAAVQGLNVGFSFRGTSRHTTSLRDWSSDVCSSDLANDAAVISGTTTGSVTEAGGVANGTPGTLTATGTLTDTDVDNKIGRASCRERG